MNDAERIQAINDALDAPIARVYGEQAPMHWGTQVRWRDGGPNPLDAVSAFWNDVGPHWHYTSQGLTELADKEAPNPDVSGWGFELTFRLAAPPSAKGPQPGGPALLAAGAPGWPLELLDVLAKVVWDRSTTFLPGQSIGFGRAPDPEGRVVAAAFVEDPQLGQVQTVNGRMRYLQVIGLVDRALVDRLRSDEHHEATMAALRGPDDLYITTLTRS